MDTLALTLTGQLTEAIVNGELAAGSKISEPDLARRYAVGRGSLREALLRLEGSGLVERSPRQGARVVALSRQQVLDIYATREALEGMAARLAAGRIGEAELSQLKALLDDHEHYLHQVDGALYSHQQGDLDFHYRIIQASGNQKLIAMLCDELYQLLRMFRRQSAALPARPERALTEHRQILDALAQGDGELAELLMRSHIARAARAIGQHLAHTEPGEGAASTAPATAATAGSLPETEELL